MNLTERDLEDYLVKSQIINVDDKEITIIKRQFRVSTYYIDMIGIDFDGNIYVFELKQNKVDGNALSQLLNYMYIVEQGIKRSDESVKVYGVLIGMGLTDYMELGLNMIDNVYFLNYRIEFGISNISYRLSDNYLNNKITQEFQELIDCVLYQIEESKEIEEHFARLKEEKTDGKKENG